MSPSPPPPTPPRPSSVNMKPLPATPDCVRSPPVFIPNPHPPYKYRNLSPDERLKRRQSIQRRRQLEDQEAIHQEQARIALRIQDEEEQHRREAEEEAKRVALVKEHLQRAAARRQREEQEAIEVEKRRSAEIRERKQSEQQRRLQYTKEMEKWRSEHIARVVSQSSEQEEERRRDAEERRNRVARLSESVLGAGANAFCGWLTIQTHDAIDWKRRYFMFDLEHAQLTLRRKPRDPTRTIDLVNLDGRVASFHEWYEGFEELEAIPHSFAVTFVDGRTWRIYADTEDDKDRLLVLFSEAAGVIV